MALYELPSTHRQIAQGALLHLYFLSWTHAAIEAHRFYFLRSPPPHEELYTEIDTRWTNPCLTNTNRSYRSKNGQVFDDFGLRVPAFESSRTRLQRIKS